jgi:hypothetical protein
LHGAGIAPCLTSTLQVETVKRPVASPTLLGNRGNRSSPTRGSQDHARERRGEQTAHTVGSSIDLAAQPSCQGIQGAGSTALPAPATSLPIPIGHPPLPATPIRWVSLRRRRSHPESRPTGLPDRSSNRSAHPLPDPTGGPALVAAPSPPVGVEGNHPKGRSGTASSCTDLIPGLSLTGIGGLHTRPQQRLIDSDTGSVHIRPARTCFAGSSSYAAGDGGAGFCPRLEEVVTAARLQAELARGRARCPSGGGTFERGSRCYQQQALAGNPAKGVAYQSYPSRASSRQAVPSFPFSKCAWESPRQAVDQGHLHRAADW